MVMSVFSIDTVFPAYADGLAKLVAATKAIETAEAEAAFLERCKAEQDSFAPYSELRKLG